MNTPPASLMQCLKKRNKNVSVQLTVYICKQNLQAQTTISVKNCMHGHIVFDLSTSSSGKDNLVGFFKKKRK